MEIPGDVLHVAMVLNFFAHCDMHARTCYVVVYRADDGRQFVEHYFV